MGHPILCLIRAGYTVLQSIQEWTVNPTSSFDPRVDAYIAKAKPFAQPILFQIRELVHRLVPELWKR